MDLPPITFQPIGVVRNDIRDIHFHDYTDVVSEIVVSPELEEGLDGIEGFSHLEVFFAFHLLESDRVTLKRRPMGREDVPEVGVFAIRTQLRPCPLAATVVQLLERRGNVLRVKGLDAVDGTPVLDIKPYPSRQMMEAEGQWRVPEWTRRLWEPPETPQR